MLFVSFKNVIDIFSLSLSLSLFQHIKYDFAWDYAINLWRLVSFGFCSPLHSAFLPFSICCRPVGLSQPIKKTIWHDREINLYTDTNTCTRMHQAPVLAAPVVSTSLPLLLSVPFYSILRHTLLIKRLVKKDILCFILCIECLQQNKKKRNTTISFLIPCEVKEESPTLFTFSVLDGGRALLATEPEWWSKIEQEERQLSKLNPPASVGFSSLVVVVLIVSS